MTKQAMSLVLLVLGVLLGAGSAFGADQKVTLKVEGLTATGCSSAPAVRGTIERTDGVTRAEVNPERGEAVAEFDPGKVDLAELMAEVERYCLVKLSRTPAP